MFCAHFLLSSHTTHPSFPFSFYSAGDHYERLLFKPVVARLIDRTNPVEICLHYEQARSDFVSGHFRSECPELLLYQLVALCVHSTAGSHTDLSAMASNIGLPFMKLWNLMPISEYVPAYTHSNALTSSWQNEVLAVMKQYEHLTPVQSRLAFLDTCASEFTFFGAMFYSCVVIADSNLMTTLGSQRLLAVTPRGISLLRAQVRQDKHQQNHLTAQNTPSFGLQSGSNYKGSSNKGKGGKGGKGTENNKSRVIDFSASFLEIGGWNIQHQKKKEMHILSIELKDSSRRFRLRGPHLDRAVRSIEVNVAIELLHTKEKKKKKNQPKKNQQKQKKPAMKRNAVTKTGEQKMPTARSLPTSFTKKKAEEEEDDKDTEDKAKKIEMKKKEMRIKKKKKRLTMRIGEHKSAIDQATPTTTTTTASIVSSAAEEEHWERHYDTSRGKSYWHNRSSKRTTWSCPVGYENDVDVDDGKDSSRKVKLGKFEKIAVDPSTGRKYAYNEQTKSTRWL